MPPVTGKTIYILGAGASFHAGAPLLNDFIVTSRFLLDSATDLKYRSSFLNIFKWIDSLRGSAYYIELDLDNIEHLYSLCEMKRQLGISDGQNLYDDLGLVIMETLDHTCRARWVNNRPTADPLYSKFIKVLKKLNDERKLKYPLSESDVIITFNYDILLDYALASEISMGYCLKKGEATNPDYIKLLKLHGSANWASCPQCNRIKEITNFSQLYRNYFYSTDQASEENENMEFPLKIVTDFISKMKCDHCPDKPMLKPLIIPPTWSKIVKDSALANVWLNAVKEIESAFQIVVIGYSMPQTDTFFQYLLTLGLSRNANGIEKLQALSGSSEMSSSLNRVIVVNKDNGDALKKRYKKVFSRSMFHRDRLIFTNFKYKKIEMQYRNKIERVEEDHTKGATFENFIEYDMYNFGRTI